MLIMIALATAALIIGLWFFLSRCTNPAIVGDMEAIANRRAARQRKHKRKMQARRAAAPRALWGFDPMKALLIIWLLSGQGFAIPFNTMADCLSAERGLDVSQVESSACEYDQ